MQPPISSADLVQHVARAGIPDAITASLAVHATLRVLGERLMDDEARALTDVFAADVAEIVDRSEYEGDFDSTEFYERVRRRMSMPAGPAREGADVVLRAVGEALDDAVRARIARVLPPALGERLSSVPLGEPEPHPEAEHAPMRATLATGRPGSQHPVSEARPPAAHAHSVARNDEPHRDTKLSSARGLTQERLRESLAEGRPPAPARPIADTHDE